MYKVKVDFDMDKIKKAVAETVAQSALDLPCPECGVKNSVNVADIAAQRTISCRGCRKAIEFRDKDGGLRRMTSGQ